MSSENTARVPPINRWTYSTGDIKHITQRISSQSISKLTQATHVPSSSSTNATPASHPLINASSPSPLSNKAYRNEEPSHASAILNVAWLVCDRSCEERALLDNEFVVWDVMMGVLELVVVDGGILNGADECDECWAGDEGRQKMCRSMLCRDIILWYW